MKIEISGIDELMKGMSESQIRSAAASASNRAGASARKASSNKVRAEWNIKQKDLYGYIKITKASSASGAYVFRLQSEPIPLAKFATKSQMIVRSGKRQKRSPLYKLKKSQPRKRVTSSFVAKVGAKHVGIFKRTKNSSLPIFELKSITPTSMFMQKAENEYIDVFEKVFTERMKHELSRRFKK